MNKLNEFLMFLSAGTEMEDGVCSAVRFLVSRGLIEYAILVRHRISPNPYQVLYSSDPHFSPAVWLGDVQADSENNEPLKRLNDSNEHIIYLLNGEASRGPVYFLLLNKELFADEKTILTAAVQLDRWRRAAVEEEAGSVQEHYANFISQIIHDSQSLMQLSLEDCSTRELKERIDYQEKSNRNILFYIREPDLFKIPVNAQDFLSDSLDLIGVNLKDLSVSLPPDLSEIQIDLELMSRAFNEIVKNAIVAVDGVFSEITIRVGRASSSSPLGGCDWLQFDVEDRGRGIPEDFIPQIQEPFFTTQKHQGATGFGLSIARKIIEAHGGFLTVTSEEGKGTTVSISLPQEHV